MLGGPKGNLMQRSSFFPFGHGRPPQFPGPRAPRILGSSCGRSFEECSRRWTESPVMHGSGFRSFSARGALD